MEAMKEYVAEFDTIRITCHSGTAVIMVLAPQAEA